MRFKDNVELQRQVEQEWAEGQTLKQISEKHTDYSEITYKRFLSGKPHPTNTEERRQRAAESQKKSWDNRTAERKEKQIHHLRALSENQQGKPLSLSEDHIKKIKDHLNSDKMREIRRKWNQRGKKPKQIKSKDSYAKTTEAQSRLQSLGLTVSVSGNRATVSYKGHTWEQYWGGSPNATCFRAMKKINTADAIQKAMNSGKSLTSACLDNNVDPVTFARHLNFTGNFYEAVITIRNYEQFLKIEDAKYNKRLGNLLIRPDVLVESCKLIIEVDGLYWHTEDKKSRKYHYERAALYKALGYKLLVFSEKEVKHQRHIVDSMIANKMGKIKNKTGARNCKTIELSTQEADLFFKTNHLKGEGSGRTIGLELEGKVICALRFQCFESEINISRFCCLCDWSVAGGYSKLLSKLDRTKTIVNFTDARHGDGEHLSALGFRKVSEHVGFEWTNGYESFNRRLFHGSSGLDHGLKRYWDYGQTKWVRDALL